MARDWDQQLSEWSIGPGAAEEEQMQRTASAVRAAIKTSPKIGGHDIEVIATGSFKNRTHVPGESDVDIAVVYHGMFYSDWHFVDPNAKTDAAVRSALQKRAGVSDAKYPDAEYRADVQAALVAAFGRSAVTRGDKAFNVRAIGARVDADVVAAFEHRRWHDTAGTLTYLEGTQFVSDSGVHIINWPAQQYANGCAKHERTNRRYKKMVRILKNLRNEMLDANVRAAEPIPSFLSECLVWNVADEDIVDGPWSLRLKIALLQLQIGTFTDDACREWGEESELKYLFRPSQPWTREQALDFLRAAYDYVGF